MHYCQDWQRVKLVKLVGQGKFKWKDDIQDVSGRIRQNCEKESENAYREQEEYCSRRASLLPWRGNKKGMIDKLEKKWFNYI